MDNPTSQHPPVAPDPTNSGTPAPGAPAESRRPFEPPQLLWTEPFQPVAYGMACAKLSGQSQQCDAFPQLS